VLEVGRHLRTLLAVVVLATLGGNAALLLQPEGMAAARSLTATAGPTTSTTGEPEPATTTTPMSEAPLPSGSSDPAIVAMKAAQPPARASRSATGATHVVAKPVRNKPDTAPRPKPAPAPPRTPIVGLLTGPDIEGYARYEGQTTCDPTPKPGTVALRNLLLARYANTTSLGISRGCDIGGVSEHKEGRAFDWGANIGNAKQVDAVNDFLNTLFATDSYGHRHALARRMGIMYVIWNNQIWSAYRADAGWQAYTGANPHTDHVHISLSWAGARAETSYYSGKVVPGLPDGSPPEVPDRPRPPAPSSTTTTVPRGERPSTTTTRLGQSTTTMPRSTTTTSRPAGGTTTTTSRFGSRPPGG
jgi:hypothetical protein